MTSWGNREQHGQAQQKDRESWRTAVEGYILQWNDTAQIRIELQWQVCHAKNKKKQKKSKADLTIVLHIRELPHLYMKLAVWFSFPTTNNKNPMIPS